MEVNFEIQQDRDDQDNTKGSKTFARRLQTPSY